MKYAYRQQVASRAKVSRAEKLTHVMASATLTRAILQLAAPVLGEERFAVVDADRKTVDEFASPEEMLHSGKSNS